MITGLEHHQIHLKVANERKVISKVYSIKSNQISKQNKYLICKIQKNRINSNKGKNY
jgi:hypothetical protein